MTEIFRQPDLSKRPERLVVDRKMLASAQDIFHAWTQRFDLWFAAPGSVLMKPEINSPFFFETEFRFEENKKAERHPHYGRFLQLEPNRLVKMTWVTGIDGTKGAETIVTVTLEPEESGTRLTLVHEGFADEPSRLQHENAWPEVLKQLDGKLKPSGT